jgi:hypothetical protein
MLVGYLENINSDRKIIEQSSLRMDILYFLDYDIDETIPWHSTLSRTRKLYGEEVFLGFFRDILRKCVKEGLVHGKMQAIDSAYIKANASMDSIVERSKKYFDEITENEDEDSTPKKPVKYNERYVSKTDPDARVSQKPRKPAALNHLGIISVDTASHIICGAAVDFADKRDSETTEKITGQTIENLQENNIVMEEVLADKNYSSGETYKYLERKNITAYIPVTGNYKALREGFTYNKEEDSYVCNKGIKLSYRGLELASDRKAGKKVYSSGTRDCKGCIQKAECCKKDRYKRLRTSIDKPYYDAAHERMKTEEGKRRIRLRAVTVEPVLGTLLNFRRMKKVYTRGNELAHKQLLMAAAAYNLKKLMKHSGLKAAKGMFVFLDEIWIWLEYRLFNNKLLLPQPA